MKQNRNMARVNVRRTVIEDMQIDEMRYVYGVCNEYVDMGWTRVDSIMYRVSQSQELDTLRAGDWSCIRRSALLDAKNASDQRYDMLLRLIRHIDMFLTHHA